MIFFRSSFFRLAMLLLAGMLAACSPKPLEFKGSDITGTGLGKDMALTDTSGQMRRVADYEGKVLVVFFGFTQCPDVCPTALAELAHAMEMLDEKADDVQVVLITVDPERDTPELLKEYVTAFDPRFDALRGSADELHKTAQSFRAYYARAPGSTPDSYTMDHSASFYVFDRKGEPRVLIGGSAEAPDIADDLRLLL
ncbi:MAG: SCO family protein [Castellaniella sp.]